MTQKMMKSLWILTIPVLLVIGDGPVKGRPLSESRGISGQIDDQHDGKLEESSWEAEYYDRQADSSHGDESNSQHVESTTREVRPHLFNESIFAEAQKDKLPVITQCHDTHMTVAVPRSALGSGGTMQQSIIAVQSACRVSIQINETHVVFDHSYDVFTEHPCPRKSAEPCCKNLKAIRYDVGAVYVFEVQIETLETGVTHRAEDVMAYCYFETAKHKVNSVSHASIQLYSQPFGGTAFNGAQMSLKSNKVAYLEIGNEEDDPHDMVNLPVNCWLSPYATKEESAKDMPDALFLKDGCPVHGDGEVSYFALARVYRARFSLESYKKLEMTFLYVHCQYLKCSIASEEGGVGKLPPCPSSSHCLGRTSLQYQKRQLSTATSDVVLEKAIPQPIDTPPAHQSAITQKGDPNENGKLQLTVPNDISCNIKKWVFIGAAGGCAITSALAFAVFYIWRRYREPSEGGPMVSTKETSIGGLRQASLDKEASARAPDVLAQTPESKRSHRCHPQCHPGPPARRQRHMAGRDGFEPPNAADSLHDYSRAGESTIALKDASWNRKLGLHDDRD